MSTMKVRWTEKEAREFWNRHFDNTGIVEDFDYMNHWSVELFPFGNDCDYDYARESYVCTAMNSYGRSFLDAMEDLFSKYDEKELNISLREFTEACEGLGIV